MKKTALKYGIASVVALLIAFFISREQGVFDTVTLKQRLLGLSNGCFVSAVLYLGMGLLMFVSGKGFFDIVSYGFMTLATSFSRDSKHLKPKETFLDYKERKRKARGSYAYLLAIGSVFFIAALGMNIWFNQI